MVELKLNLKIVLPDGFELIKEPNFWLRVMSHNFCDIIYAFKVYRKDSMHVKIV